MLAKTSPYPINIKVKEAKGSFIIDATGKKYLDFTAGISVNNLGHQILEVNEAVIDQLQRHTHVMVYGEYQQNSVMNFAETLTSLLPKNLNTVYPLNSGTEAIEAAIKIAKRFTNRHKIISFTGAYHGNTHGSMSVSHNESKKSAFRPLLPGVEFLEWNNIEELDSINNQVACVLLETVQGDAGVRIPSAEFLKTLRKTCSNYNVLLILDEIQCGYGRTGNFSAFTNFGITPDILCLGKALGGGFPIGAVVSDEKIMQCIQQNPALGHITTFGGNPVICAAANAALKKYKELEASLEVQKKGKHIGTLLQHHELVVTIRQIGLMIGIELASSELVERLIVKCREKGLLLFWFLSVPNGFRISPPLSISMEEIELGCSILLNELNTLVEK